MPKVRALKCEQNGQYFYIAVINSSILKRVCFISRREDNPRKGFQRLLNKKRARDISKYLDELKGIIPAALILSAQTNANLEYSSSKQLINFANTPECLLVLDGQHRLYGLIQSKKFYDFPVVIFPKLTTAEEVKLFIDINTNQKGVPSALLLDIKQIAGIETKIEEVQREIFDKLSKKSALAGYLSPSSSVSGKISRSAFNEATKEIFHKGPLFGKPVDIVYKGIKNYLDAADRVFKRSKSPDARIHKTVLFRSLFTLFNEVLTRSLSQKRNLKVSSIEDILSPLSQLEFETYTGTNKATINKIVEDMRSEINEYSDVNPDMF